MTDQAREMRLRRKADRQGLTLRKSRRRDPHALDYGKYALIDPRTNGIVFGVGSGRYDADLDDIEAFLSGSPPWRAEQADTPPLASPSPPWRQS